MLPNADARRAVIVTRDTRLQRDVVRAQSGRPPCRVVHAECMLLCDGSCLSSELSDTPLLTVRSHTPRVHIAYIDTRPTYTMPRVFLRNPAIDLRVETQPMYA